MSSGRKCNNCGSADIEVDNARGDAVCTNCGSVLEDNIIVSEVQFEENAHGASSAVGQFVASDSKGGATAYGKFHVGTGTESREVTLRKARQGITHLCHQLHLNNHCIETACNFFKMALIRHLTRGRRNTHIYAACVYITCRTEGTSHLLIDISDVLQICCYELGRTYLKLSQALCINIPSIDPCIYIMRYANKLEFAEKTHEVSMTAQRLVQRMKKDSIHSGRRPSGLCGAALLLAARMHDYSRTPNDIVRIVKIHESTLRKRLVEFGETPSSALTLDEFMSVDLEAEQDPPAFKAARKKDKERLQKLGESTTEFNQLQAEIDAALDRDLHKTMSRKRHCKGEDFGVDESRETDQFINESTIDVINQCLDDDPDDPRPDGQGNVRLKTAVPEGIKPDLMAMCSNAEQRREGAKQEAKDDDGDLISEDLDDEEIDGYIMTEEEARYKDMMWNRLHAEYLKEMKEKEDRLAKEREEGKPEKKKRKNHRKKVIGPSNSAGEAIEKMLQEKKISSKINYDILKTLTDCASTSEQQPETPVKQESSDIDILSRTRIKPETALSRSARSAVNLSFPGRRKPIATLPVISSVSENVKLIDEEPPTPKVEHADQIDDYDDDVDAEPEPEPEPEHKSLADMLNTGDDEDYYGYEEDY
ncbi:transcription factor IIIB 90 kDa subunit [Topomyia yanbarensis]|uniref:transcription factor IIIB 90 kDa subunit n=1 Tax=Topomyia yanbarensis TaxID=2498891 RepID=UPI00273AA1E3|nr:transcription factor IIIB 90 kDa subunit [Topomyia yanbarensis]XP_058813518.1 transcription factor IIIB 90 kDa subunit [Topomyia yanbarensis]